MECLGSDGNTNRRNTLKMMGGIGIASILGTGATGTVAADNHSQGGQSKNPGRIATYNGKKTKTAPSLGGFSGWRRNSVQSSSISMKNHSHNRSGRETSVVS